MGARRGIRFYTPNIVLDVNLHALKAIRDELEKIAATNLPRPDVTRLLDELKLHVVELSPISPTFTPDDQQRAILLRATDHLNNLGRHGKVHELLDLLSGTGGFRPIRYRLRDIKGGPPYLFTGFSSPYNVGDRLVDARGEHRIVGVSGGDPLEFVVDTWRPAE